MTNASRMLLCMGVIISSIMFGALVMAIGYRARHFGVFCSSVLITVVLWDYFYNDIDRDKLVFSYDRAKKRPENA